MKILFIISILIALTVITYLVIEFKVKKWKCTEGKCEKVIGGDFSSLEKCRKMCQVKQNYYTDSKRRLLKNRRERAKSVHWDPQLVNYLN